MSTSLLSRSLLSCPAVGTISMRRARPPISPLLIPSAGLRRPPRNGTSAFKPPGRVCSKNVDESSGDVRGPESAADALDTFEASSDVFSNEERLREFLGSVNPQFVEYASSLWDDGKGVLSLSILATADSSALVEYGVRPLHTGRLKQAAQRALARSRPLILAPRDVVAAPEAVQKTFQALRASTIQGRFLCLPQGATFALPSLVLDASRLFVRLCYEDFLAIIRSRLLRPGSKITAIIIAGSPGIGKSCFLYFLWKQLKDEGVQNIVWECTVEGFRYLFREEGPVLRGPIDAFSNLLDDPKTMLFIDGATRERPASVHACKTVIVNSPDRKPIAAVLRLETERYFMPPWDLEETLKAAVLYPELNEGLVRSLYGKWAGLTRYTLKHALNPSQQADMETALERLRAEDLLAVEGKAAGPLELPHRIIHILPSPDYLRFTYVLPTAYVRDRVVDQAWEESQYDILRFVVSTSALGAAGVMKGQVLERLAHRFLMKGGWFYVESLEPGDSEQDGEWIFLDIDSVLVFRSDADLCKCLPKQYAYKGGEGLPAVDAVVRDQGLFQMTQNLGHGMRTQTLKKTLERLVGANGKKPLSEFGQRLFFVVPPDRFEAFKKQPYVTAQRKTSREAGLKDQGDSGEIGPPPGASMKDVPVRESTQRRGVGVIWEEDEMSGLRRSSRLPKILQGVRQYKLLIPLPDGPSGTRAWFTPPSGPPGPHPPTTVPAKTALPSKAKTLLAPLGPPTASSSSSGPPSTRTLVEEARLEGGKEARAEPEQGECALEWSGGCAAVDIAERDPGGAMVRSLQGTKHTIDEKFEQGDITLLRGGQAVQLDSQDLDLEDASEETDAEAGASDDGGEDPYGMEGEWDAGFGVSDDTKRVSDSGKKGSDAGRLDGKGQALDGLEEDPDGGKGSLDEELSGSDNEMEDAGSSKRAVPGVGQTSVDGNGVNEARRAAPKERKEEVGGRVRRRAVFDDVADDVAEARLDANGMEDSDESDESDDEVEGVLGRVFDQEGKRNGSSGAGESSKESDGSEGESNGEGPGGLGGGSPEEESDSEEGGNSEEEEGDSEGEGFVEEESGSEDGGSESEDEGREGSKKAPASAEAEAKGNGFRKQEQKMAKATMDPNGNGIRKQGPKPVVLPPPPPGGPSAPLRSAEVERAGPPEESDDVSEDRMEGTSGGAAQWKEGLFSKMTLAFSKKVNLTELLYGRSKGTKTRGGEESETSVEENFFRPKRRGAQKAPGESGDDVEELDVEDFARLPSEYGKLAEFDDSEDLEGLRDRFVTGDWEKAERRRKGDVSDDEDERDEDDGGSDDEVFGDFEYLEMGEKVAGTGAAEGADPEAEERRLKKLALRAKIDAKYSGLGGGEEDEEEEGGESEKGSSGRPKKGYMQSARDAAVDDHHAMVKKGMEERRLRNQAELAMQDPELRCQEALRTSASDWGLNGLPVVSDPDNVLARKMGISVCEEPVRPCIQRYFDTYKNNQVCAPGYVIVNQQGAELLAWHQTPTVHNIGGAIDRPIPSNVMTHLENRAADNPGVSDVRNPTEVLDDFAPYIEQVICELPDGIRELMVEERRIVAAD